MKQIITITVAILVAALNSAHAQSEADRTNARLWAIDHAAKLYNVVSPGARSGMTNWLTAPGVVNEINKQAQAAYPKDKALQAWFVEYATAYTDRLFELIEELHTQPLAPVFKEVRFMEEFLADQSPMSDPHFSAPGSFCPLYNALYGSDTAFQKINGKLAKIASEYKGKIKFAKDGPKYSDEIGAKCRATLKELFPTASEQWIETRIDDLSREVIAIAKS